MKVTSIIFAGVGGQGVILASEIAALAAMEEGCDVKQSEVHGVAQRGGAVVSHLRFGKKVYSPVCVAGETDFLFAMELLESLRWSHYLSEKGVALANNQKIEPVRLDNDKREYPSDISGFFEKNKIDFHLIEGYSTAKELGNFRVANIVMLGCLSHFLPFSEERWVSVLKKRIPSRFMELNLKAFESGRNSVKQCC